MNAVICLSHDDVGVFHLKSDSAATETLCGKRAFPAYRKRVRVTCQECKRRKPRILGGAT